MLGNIVLHLVIGVLFVAYIAPYIWGYVALGLFVHFIIIEGLLRLVEAGAERRTMILFSKGWMVQNFYEDFPKWVGHLFWVLWPIPLFIVALGSVTYLICGWLPITIVTLGNKKPNKPLESNK